MMKTITIALSLCVALAGPNLRAQTPANDPAKLPEYVPGPPVPGTIRVWGNDFMAKVEGLWEAGFRRYHPEVTFDDTLKSSAQGIGALYTGVGDVALLGREVWPTEVLGFTKMFQYEPLSISGATGSLEAEGKTWPFAIFVNKNNPLEHLTLQQLDAIFCRELKRGAKEPIKTWGQLGLTGAWADQPIHMYGYDRQIPGFTYAFEQMVFNGSDRWAGEMQEFYNAHYPNGKLIHTAGDLMLDKLRNDPYGIAWTGLQFANDGVKPLALGANDSGPYVPLNLKTTADRTYPLVRSIRLYINRAPGKPVDPRVKAYLEYVLSRQGQQDVQKEGDFLPMTAAFDKEQRRKLE